MTTRRFQLSRIGYLVLSSCVVAAVAEGLPSTQHVSTDVNELPLQFDKISSQPKRRSFTPIFEAQPWCSKSSQSNLTHRLTRKMTRILKSSAQKECCGEVLYSDKKTPSSDKLQLVVCSATYMN